VKERERERERERDREREREKDYILFGHRRNDHEGSKRTKVLTGFGLFLGRLVLLLLVGLLLRHRFVIRTAGEITHICVTIGFKGADILTTQINTKITVTQSL